MPKTKYYLFFIVENEHDIRYDDRSMEIAPAAAANDSTLSDPGSPATATHAAVNLDWLEGGMRGEPVKESAKLLGDLKGIFREQDADANPGREVYRVRWWAPVAPGTEGGLFWGVTVLQPGKVGDEYFMTHGHFHANRTRAEFYGTVAGRGMLLHMAQDRRTRAEEMAPGTLHSISGQDAHRVVNTGDTPLIFWACWPSDAGYDYGTIAEQGFSVRVVERDGKAVLVPGE
jgi:glucose-6-phosphate isomerase, archaeal